LIEDARRLAPGTQVAADVCIVGAGAAGITIARALEGSGLAVCLVESGGLEADAATQDLYRGSVVGQAYHGLETTRARFFGGSTNCWYGYCRPLDPIDFSARDEVPHSGWPFERAALDAYYGRAQRALALGPYDYSPQRWEVAGVAPPPLDEMVRSRVFQFGKGPLRMGTAYRQQLEAAPHTRVLLHANARHIQLHASGQRVEGIQVQCLGGPGFRVSARAYVLAAGGIENPRLLLASRDVHGQGIGNQHDLVGRFFMEHLHLRSGLFLSHTPAGLEFYEMRQVGEDRARGILSPSEEWLRSERLLNHDVQLWPDPQDSEGELPRAVAAASAETDARREGARKQYRLVFHCEQAPNPASRVRLSGERDALGMPRVALDWRLLEIDERSARRAHRLVAQAVGLARLGRVRVLLPDGAAWRESIGGGNHHMGTTRMHVDPKQGVVDERGYVHGVGNLLVAGSSVFPTAGAANPTLTIVALAYRLADELRRALR
jgi:choline dehydrogenase-like flavoprotein